MKCIQCNEETVYDAPEDYCEQHWFEWFVPREKFNSDEEWQNQIKEDIKNLRKHGW
jgi:hypothetical protein